MAVPTPRSKAPKIEVETVGGDIWRLADSAPDAFTMIVFYRGLHCPICKQYLRELDRRAGDFAARGVTCIAISGDDKARAEQTAREWGFKTLRVGYGQSIDSMREWGLFISRSIRQDEPEAFGEPGLFLIKPDGTVYCETIASMPFARPRFDDVLQAVDFVTKANYPARGEA